MEAILIAIIVGIIGAIANKNKLEKAKSNKQTSTPRSLFGEMQKTFEENIKKISPEVVSAPAPKKHENDKIYRDKKLEAELQTDHLKNQEEIYVKRIEQINKKVEDIKTGETHPLINDGNDLVKGIILAEVLGPPRSKKPYRRN